MPISHWLGDNNDSHFKSITNTVRQALSHIQHKSNVDMIWWMQGESDNNPNHNAYFGQLQNLINKFRAQNWYDSSRYFLANETGWFVDANAGIRLAGQDNDANTDFSPSPLKFQSSFSNAQLRYLTGYNVAEPHFLRLDITSDKNQYNKKKASCEAFFLLKFF